MARTRSVLGVRRRGRDERAHRVVLVVENESVPTDLRVWGHATVLRDAGYDVTVVCPVGVERDLEVHATIDGITVRRFPVRRAGVGLRAYVAEYVTASCAIARILWRLPGPLAVVQVANPPDGLCLLALGAKLRWGAKVVFDHHDLVPELFTARFGSSRWAGHVLRLVERANFAAADVVLSTNESYRRVAITRGGKRPTRVRVVRNARDPRSYCVPRDPALRRGKTRLAVYVGVIGPQDGGDHAVQVAAEYRRRRHGRDDLHVCVIGDGAAAEWCRRLAVELGVDDMVEFTGWLQQDDVRRYLASADIGLATDPPTPFNDHSTMIKVVEYLAAGLPVVSFDLAESRISAGDAALYATDGSVTQMADHVARLVNDRGAPRHLRERALARAHGPLSPEHSQRELLATYTALATAWQHRRSVSLGGALQPGRGAGLRRPDRSTAERPRDAPPASRRSYLGGLVRRL